MPSAAITNIERHLVFPPVSFSFDAEIAEGQPLVMQPQDSDPAKAAKVNQLVLDEKMDATRSL